MFSYLPKFSITTTFFNLSILSCKSTLFQVKTTLHSGSLFLSLLAFCLCQYMSFSEVFFDTMKKEIHQANKFIAWLNIVSSASPHMVIMFSNSFHHTDDTWQSSCFATSETILSAAGWLSESWSNACTQMHFIWVMIIRYRVSWIVHL